MEGALPYRIPGPAGGISTQPQNSYASSQKPVFELFRTPPWRQMLAHLNRKIPSSIALLRRNALSNEFVKLCTLPVLIDSLVQVGKNASVLLRDPTGLVRGTIHAEVFEERKGMLKRGVVILLNGVSALAYVEESRGFRGGDDVIHLSVQACHVSEVFKGGNTVPPTPRSRTLLDDYEPQARSPKPVVKPPITRLPLRERNYSRLIGRPVSRGVQSSPRGGATTRGRGRPPHPPQHSHHPSHQRMHQQHPGQPPHYKNPSHQRPMLTSIQHKQPFRPPVMRSNMMQGTPPPQKRANVRNNQQADWQPRQQPHTVQAITDDQLDSLLGDLDVDAVIAAHGKSTTLVERNASSDVQKQPPEKKKSRVAPPPSDEQQSKRLQTSACATPTENTNPSDAKSCRSGDATNTEDAARRAANASSARDVQATALANTPESRAVPHATDKTAQIPHASSPHDANDRTISNVDQDMVNDLFDGVDSADFM